MYKLLVNNFINRKGTYKVKVVGGKILLYNHNKPSRVFNNYKECYDHLKMLNYLELI